MSLCPQEKREAIAEYLRTNARNGKTYFKSKNIADALGLSSREVGCNMKTLAEREPGDLSIEPWSVTKSTTWRVDIQPRMASPIPAGD